MAALICVRDDIGRREQAEMPNFSGLFSKRDYFAEEKSAIKAADRKKAVKGFFYQSLLGINQCTAGKEDPCARRIKQRGVESKNDEDTGEFHGCDHRHVFILSEHETLPNGEIYVPRRHPNEKNQYVSYSDLGKQEDSVVKCRNRDDGSLCFEDELSLHPYMETLVVDSMPNFAMTACRSRQALESNQPTSLRNISISSYNKLYSVTLNFCRLDGRQFSYGFLEGLVRFFNSSRKGRMAGNIPMLARYDEFCWLNSLIASDDPGEILVDGKSENAWDYLRGCKDLRVLRVRGLLKWKGPNPFRYWPNLVEFGGEISSNIKGYIWKFSRTPLLKNVYLEAADEYYHFDNPQLTCVEIRSTVDNSGAKICFSENCVALESLKISHDRSSGRNETFSQLLLLVDANLPVLVELELTDVTIDDRFAEALAACTTLGTFKAYNCSGSSFLKIPENVVTLILEKKTACNSIIFSDVMPKLWTVHLDVLAAEVVFPTNAPDLYSIDMDQTSCLENIRIEGVYPSLRAFTARHMDSVSAIVLNGQFGPHFNCHLENCPKLRTLEIQSRQPIQNQTMFIDNCIELFSIHSTLRRDQFHIKGSKLPKKKNCQVGMVIGNAPIAA